MQSPYLPHKYDLNNIVYDDIEKSSESDDRIIIKLFDKKKGCPLYIQTPEVTNIFGAVKRKNYYELLLPLGGVSSLGFRQFLNNLQNKVLFDANQYKKSWFKELKGIKFVPIIKEINKDVTSTFEQTEELDKCSEGMLKIKVTSGTVVKKDNEEINIDELTKNKKIRMIIQIYAIWINNSDATTFGIYIKPEIIEEKNCYNLTFIEERVIFDSDDDSSVSSNESDDEN